MNISRDRNSGAIILIDNELNNINSKHKKQRKKISNDITIEILEQRIIILENLVKQLYDLRNKQ